MTLFQAEEYLERIRATKMRMTDAGIDVLIVCDPAKTVKSLTLRPGDSDTDWTTTNVVFNLMALTTVAP